MIELLRGALPPAPPKGSHTPAVQSLSGDEFMRAVAASKDSIAKGDVYQLVLSVQFTGRHTLSPFETYRALRLLNPSPYMFFVDLGDIQVAGSSPEALVKLRRGHASLRPIAGTRPRGATPEQDAGHEQSLLADEKENAEHVMLVDLARNDLGRVAAAGSVYVDPYRCIERYSHVMHIVSGVQGELAAGKDAFDLFAAAFPAGTLVGAPKVRAMELIDELEPVRRGLYAGTVGYFGSNGDMDQAIAIRTLIFRGDTYQLPGGRRHRGRQRAGERVQRGAGEERDPAQRPRHRGGRTVSAAATTARQPKLLLIDNYDSFTYNLVQAFLVLGAEVLVYRNDELTVAEALALKPTHLCISPGPGRPDDAGVSLQMLAAFEGRVPVLGVCLGPPVPGAALRRAHRVGRPADARQDLHDRPRRPHHLRRA